jgi:hypothetical protein
MMVQQQPEQLAPEPLPRHHQQMEGVLLHHHRLKPT